MHNRYLPYIAFFLGSSKAVTMAVVTAGHVECRLGDGPGNACWTRFELDGAGQGLPLKRQIFTCEGGRSATRQTHDKPGRKPTQSPHSDAMQWP